MITALKQSLYGYIFDKATKEEYEELVLRFKKEERFRCIICNKDAVTLLGLENAGDTVVINGSLPDNIFFLNKVM